MDVHNEKDDEIEFMKSKVADLEDRSRRNNVKLLGVAESVSPSSFRQYVQEFIATLLPNTPDREVIVDRAHRLAKP